MLQTFTFRGDTEFHSVTSASGDNGYHELMQFRSAFDTMRKTNYYREYEPLYKSYGICSKRATRNKGVRNRKGTGKGEFLTF